MIPLSGNSTVTADDIYYLLLKAIKLIRCLILAMGFFLIDTTTPGPNQFFYVLLVQLGVLLIISILAVDLAYYDYDSNERMGSIYKAMYDEEAHATTEKKVAFTAVSLVSDSSDIV